MRKKTATWTISKLKMRIPQINFPEYQREPTVWVRNAKQRLIDSIVREFDIASLYFYDNGDGSWDCVDGRQRIAAIMSFLGEETDDNTDVGFEYKILNEIYEDESGHPFVSLKDMTLDDIRKLALSGDEKAKKFAEAFHNYQLTVVELSQSAIPEEFNLQFTRLNLGAIINSGEKLHAMVGELRDICFDRLANNPFLGAIQIPTRRYAREQLAAQITAQIFALERSRESRRNREFVRIRHMDLQRHFKQYQQVSEQAKEWIAQLEVVMNRLADQLIALPTLTSRSLVLSVVLLAYERRSENQDDLRQLARFLTQFVERLKWAISEVGKGHGIDERYHYLIEFRKHLTQASAEKSAVAARTQRLEQSLDYWLKTGGRLEGDEDTQEHQPKE